MLTFIDHNHVHLTAMRYDTRDARPVRFKEDKDANAPMGCSDLIGARRIARPERYTCRKLDRATYFGRCINGKLEGLSVVLAEGSAKDGAEWVLTYFDKGRVAFPALMAYRDQKLIGIREERSMYGCVVFGQWDRSATRDSCLKFIAIWGREIFGESTLRSLKDGTFNLNRYGPGFVKYISGQNPPSAHPR